MSVKRLVVIGIFGAATAFVIHLGGKTFAEIRQRQAVSQMNQAKLVAAESQGDVLMAQVRDAFRGEWKETSSWLSGTGRYYGENGFYRRTWQDFIFENEPAATRESLNAAAERLAELPAVIAWQKEGSGLGEQREKRFQIVEDRASGGLRLHIDFLALSGDVNAFNSGFR